MSVLNPYDVLLANNGTLKIDDVELAELKSLEVKMTADTKELGMMNSATKGEVTTAYKGDITFELNKVYSRFKPEILRCAKALIPFTFNLEATVHKSTDTDQEERIYIANCWIKGDINLFTLKADNDFLSETYTAGFKIEDCDFDDAIDDGESWITLS
jgi:hypothetical protein